MKNFITITLLSLFMFSSNAMAEPLKVGAGATINSVLTAQKNKRVTVRLKSGGELTGKVKSINNAVVHLGALDGRDYFDAVVALKKIEAVIIRTKN